MDDLTQNFRGSLSLYRCYGCTFQILSKRGLFEGNYRLTKVKLELARSLAA